MRSFPLTHLNPRQHWDVQRGEVNNLPSLTVPDQALSIAEILNRFVKKMPLEALPGIYTQDEFVPVGLEKMDAIEKAQYAKDIKKSIAKHQNQAKLAPQPRAIPDEAHPDPEM